MLNTATATMDTIKAAPTSDLLEAYNVMNGKPIKKFRDRATAEKLVWKLIGQLAPGEDITKTIMKGKSPAKITREVSPSPSPAPEREAKAKPVKAKKRDDYEHRIIKVLIKENPKRVNTRAHKKFGILMEMDGKTIGEYKAKEGKFPTLDMEKGWAATEIRWALKQSWIKIVNPE